MNKQDAPSERSKPHEVSYSDPIFTPKRKLAVICIGAGASGLLLAYKLDRHFGDYELKIYEKNADTGGTWFENRYPGCACDVPAHCYTWSFEPKTDWSATYASSQEIHQYFKQFATKYNLNRFIKLSHEVVSAIWDESLGSWNLIIRDNLTGVTFRDSAQVVVSDLVGAGSIWSSWLD